MVRQLSDIFVVLFYLLFFLYSVWFDWVHNIVYLLFLWNFSNSVPLRCISLLVVLSCCLYDLIFCFISINCHIGICIVILMSAKITISSILLSVIFLYPISVFKFFVLTFVLFSVLSIAILNHRGLKLPPCLISLSIRIRLIPLRWIILIPLLFFFL